MNNCAYFVTEVGVFHILPRGDVYNAELSRSYIARIGDRRISSKHLPTQLKLQQKAKVEVNRSISTAIV